MNHIEYLRKLLEYLIENNGESWRIVMVATRIQELNRRRGEKCIL